MALSRDVTYAIRGLRRDAGVTALAVGALALGIGAATAIFSVVDNVLLDPFPYRAAPRIAVPFIHDTTRSGPGGRGAFVVPEFLDYARDNHVFEEVVGVSNSDVLYTTREGTERLQGAEVTPNAFDFLGIKPLLGRGLQPEDGKPAAPRVFVMSYKMWVKYFNRDRGLLGRTFILNSEPRTLVGIMPPRFTYFGADLWTVHDADPAEAGADKRYLMLQGRLKPGVTLSQAAADFDVIARREAKVRPTLYPEKFSVQVQSLVDMVVGRFRTTLMVLLAAVGLLLLIACANVANMLLARATAREKEMAIRAALGASRWRIARQLLVEAGMLAAGGAVLGCGLAYAAVKLLIRAIPQGTIPDEAVIRLNVPVLLFCLGAAVLTTLLSGLAPALHASRRQLGDPLRNTTQGAGGGGARHARLRDVLVAAEIALSVVLLAGAGLMMRTLIALQSVDLGLNPDNVLVVRLPLPKETYKTAAARQRFFSQVLQRLSNLPGVVAATETSTLPPYGGIGSDVDVPGRTHTERWRAIYQLCSEGYFPTIGLKLLRGRVLTPAEVQGARKVAVVNETLAKKFFGKDDPLGRDIVLKDLATSRDPVANPVFQIVGVTRDAKNQGIQEPPMPEAFIPYTVTAAYERGILVRTRGNPMAMLNAVRREIWAVDRGVALTLTGTMEQYLQSFSYAQPRFTLMILSIFAGIGLALVAAGTYSVISYNVSRRTHEIGIRMALGAGGAQVFGMVLRTSAVVVGAGLVVGIAASGSVNRLIASQLWGVKPNDMETLASVAAVIALVGFFACLVPARKAAQVDPAVSLRYE